MTSIINVKQFVITFLVLIGLSFMSIGLTTSVVSAQEDPAYNPGGSARQGSEGNNDNCATGDGSGSDCTVNTETKSLPQIAAFIINIFSWIVGVVSVIMIIYGGFRYITSGGDSNSVTSAKNTILYAIIGLVIVALAQVIVNFVLDKTNTIGGETSSLTVYIG
jgi:hypothetical protein